MPTLPASVTRKVLSLKEQGINGRLPNRRQQWRHMRIGEALYLDGQPMTECANCYQRAGWLAAEAADYREDVGYSECAPYIQ